MSFERSIISAMRFSGITSPTSLVVVLSRNSAGIGMFFVTSDLNALRYSRLLFSSADFVSLPCLKTGLKRFERLAPSSVVSFVLSGLSVVSPVVSSVVLLFSSSTALFAISSINEILSLIFLTSSRIVFNSSFETSARFDFSSNSALFNFSSSSFFFIFKLLIH